MSSFSSVSTVFFSQAKVRRIYEIKKEMHKHLLSFEPLARLELATYALRSL
nr:MAG TPA: hypothetical protein [Caudoviricetes sp.]DAZ37404.1 MAG TPA: hypothetical protein [Caudoviricetes sp.]